MNNKFTQLRQLAERAIGGSWQISVSGESAPDGSQSAELHVGIGTHEAHHGIAEFVWTFSGDSPACLGPSTNAARSTAQYITAANPNAVLDALDRIEQLERILCDAGYALTEEGALPPDEATIPRLNLTLQDALRRIERQQAFIETLTGHIREVSVLASQGVEIADLQKDLRN